MLVQKEALYLLGTVQSASLLEDQLLIVDQKALDPGWWFGSGQVPPDPADLDEWNRLASFAPQQASLVLKRRIVVVHVVSAVEDH